ncbi:lamin tail domain-containing protein [Streptomyces sp. NPDC086787]|uniref:lamin tail domain-containing protein n=1 Tax=Streptomyces sp. NPDC086787 TaxID=3365759 RepID=UPI003822AE77
MSASASLAARRLTAATALAAAVVSAAALPAAAADRPVPGRGDRIVISDVRHDAQRGGFRSNRLLNQEWVEITNNDRRGLDLEGWTLSDADGHTYAFRHYRLDGHSSVRVHTGFGRDDMRDVYQDRRDYVWDRGGDSAVLRNNRGRIVDARSWGDERRHAGEGRDDHRRDDHRDGSRSDHRDDNRGEHRGGGRIDHRDGNRDERRDGHRRDDRRDGSRDDHRENRHEGNHDNHHGGNRH